jgi:hypothetical protein
VFVGTTNGVVAFSARDPMDSAPVTVPVTGLGFLPIQVMASGSRVYFLGTSIAVGATGSRVPLAYVDVPPDPFATKIPGNTVLATLNRISTDPLVLVPRGNDTALLVDTNPLAAWASAALEPPMVEPLALDATAIVSTAGATPVAASGSRLVMGQISAAGTPVFGFVNGAGSAAPQTVADVSLATAAPGAAPLAVAQSADGAAFFAYFSLTSAPPGPPAPAIRAVRGVFFLEGSAAPFDATAAVDVELYVPPAGVGAFGIGSVAMLDAHTAMVATASATNPAGITNVSFVRKQPLELVKNGDGQTRRFQVPLSVSQVAAAGSHGLGYLLAVDPASPTTPTVNVFDPACAP